MVWKKMWRAVESFLAGEARGIVRDVEETMDKTIEKAEKKIEVYTVNALKASIVFLLIFIGLIFVLVGLSGYISEAWNLSDGLGHLIVGGVMLLLGLFAKMIR